MDIKKYLNVLDSNTNEVLQLIKKNSNHELSKKEEGKWREEAKQREEGA